MSDQYLWDRGGPEDPEIARLEQLLGRLRSTPPEPDWEARARVVPRRMPAVFLAVAAALVLAAAASLRLASGAGAQSWAVVRVAGSPAVGGATVADTARLRTGDWLTTDGASRASVAVGAVGQLDVDPATRLRVLSTREGDQRLSLERGTVHAIIWAPPGEFAVETPASTAVDLGCAYTLSVAPDGASLIDVTLGWVGFEYQGREAFIPAGARCATRPRVGPGTPYYADAPDGLVTALATLDDPAARPEARASALEQAIALARPRDAVTLWHLLATAPQDRRDRVYDALAAVAPPPPGVTKDGIRAGSRAMRDAWWDELGLGTSGWWRVWERKWR